MAKVKWAGAAHRRRKRLLAKTKGYYGDRRTRLRKARETLLRAMVYATRDRKVRKRTFRSLWIIRLNAAARERGLTYGQFMAACRKANVRLNRKQLAELAVNDREAFNSLCAEVAAGPAR
jgi:large subunit ribosomal protein L20